MTRVHVVHDQVNDNQRPFGLSRVVYTEMIALLAFDILTVLKFIFSKGTDFMILLVVR